VPRRLTDAKLAAAFDLIDVDQDGVISQGECMQAKRLAANGRKRALE